MAFSGKKAVVTDTGAWAVVVAYRPNVQAIGNLCHTLELSGFHVAVVDNTPAPDSKGLDLPAGVHYLPQHRNTGIARAQNIGIREALSAGACAVLILDQDSLITKDCAVRLLDSLDRAAPMVVAPKLIDEKAGVEFPAVRLSPLGRPRQAACGDRQAPMRVDVVIASGTLATRQAFEVAGLMEEGLFIDYVDTVWSLRCWKAGLPTWVVPTAVLRHRIGTEARPVGGTWVQVHSPLRCYYQFRNTLLLFREDRAPWAFAAHSALSLLWSRILLLGLVKPKMPYLRAYVLGIAHGIRGVSGEASPRVQESLSSSGPAAR